MTDCNNKQLEFQGIKSKKVVTEFNGGKISTDAGALLLREVEGKYEIIQQFADCFEDLRDPDQTEFSVSELIAQRIYGIALGYEDLNDHDELRTDPVLAVLTGRADPEGNDRHRHQDKGNPLAGKSTLNRLELCAETEADRRYKKISVVESEVENLFIEYFLQQHREVPESIILDVDATNDPLYGNQEGRFFHGYYDEYCYLPLYIFCGNDLLCAKLREAGIDASEGTVEEISRIIGRIREEWPGVRITIRGDSGFCRNEIMRWCEANNVEFIFGLPKNDRLITEIEYQLYEARQEFEQTGETARVYKDFQYQTRSSWDCARRVIAKAEYGAKGSNPRFVVTSYTEDEIDAKPLYEQKYCARGDMENRIKEQQLCLFSIRTSSSKMKTNQLRLWFSSIAYVLVNAFRNIGLKGTKMERAQCHTIREKIFKIGSLVKISFRRVFLMLASGYPYKEIFYAAFGNIQKVAPLWV